MTLRKLSVIFSFGFIICAVSQTGCAERTTIPGETYWSNERCELRSEFESGFQSTIGHLIFECPSTGVREQVLWSYQDRHFRVQVSNREPATSIQIEYCYPGAPMIAPVDVQARLTRISRLEESLSFELLILDAGCDN